MILLKVNRAGECNYNCLALWWSISTTGSRFNGMRASPYDGQHIISFLLKVTDVLTFVLQPHERFQVQV